MMNHIPNKKILFVLLSCIFLLKNSISLAFECKKATKASEFLVCSSAELMQDDKQLNIAFKNTLQRLSQEEKRNLYVEQNDFLSLRDVCTKSTDHAQAVICLDKLYKERIAQLSSWPNDRPKTLMYSNNHQTLVMNLFLNRYGPFYQIKYLTKYELRDKQNNILNRGQFQGCTYGGIIINIADYLKERDSMIVTPVKNGFAIHFQEGCGAKTIWRLNVITPMCTVSAPATDNNGERISIGDNPQKIAFAYLEGFGASRKITNDYFIIDEKGMIRLSQTQPAFKDSVTLACK